MRLGIISASIEKPRNALPGAGYSASPENNTFLKRTVRTRVQFTYIHKSVYGSSAFA
jgi:hypothetical protein